MSSSYNFKDNLTINNNKYLKWLDITGTSRGNIITLDSLNNVNLNSSFGDLIVNSSNFMLLNLNNTNGVIIGSKVGIGFNNTSNLSADLTLVKNGFIGINTTRGTNNGFLGLVGGYSGSNTSGSRILLYGNDTLSSGGQLQLYAGNNTSGQINFYTLNDSLKFQILPDGTSKFTPDGVTSRLNINDTRSLFSNDVVITSSTESYNASSGCLQIKGGIGILGNLYVDGTISLNTTTGNINFDSSEISSSYTTGAIFLTGGIGISTTVNASSITAGGAMSIAGGVAIGKDTYIGGKLTINDSTVPTSSQTGSVVLYGGLGLNGPIFLRNNNSSQIKLAPMTIGSETSISFYSANNFSSTSNTGSSWIIGQNVNSVGSGNFNLYNTHFGNVLSSSYNDGNLKIWSTENSIGDGTGGSLTIAGGTSIGKNLFIGGPVLKIPTGDTNSRPSNPNVGYIRYNTEISQFEGYGPGNSWGSLGSGGGGGSITGGAVITGGNITTGSIFITSTENSIGVGTGGSLTVLGGASINKDVYVGGTITSSSDIRLKSNIRNFKKDGENFLDKIENIRTILFNYKEDTSLVDQVGFIAQDFEETFPELLRRPNPEGYYSLDYQKMSVVLLECVKELYDEILELRFQVFGYSN